jgi:hypothetical protein
MLLYRPGFEETPSEIENLIEKTDKIYLLYERNNIKIDYIPNNDEYKDLGISKTNETFYTIEENKEDSKSSVEMLINDSYRRKSSLLKRSTSEPKLNKMDSDSVKSIEIKVEKSKLEDSIDDPYNEAYFHIFENILNDHILSKYKIKN